MMNSETTPEIRSSAPAAIQRKAWDAKRSLAQHRSAVIFVLIFLVNLLLVSPLLTPTFAEVNPDDEAKYVESGWRLLRGDIRDLAWGPLVSLVYAPIHLIAGGSPDWFMLEVWAGRIMLFSFLWWTFFYLALQFKDQASPYIMLGVLFLSSPFFSIVKNQSDAVFVGLSALALAHLMRYMKFLKIRDLALGSLMVGLGVLARMETILLVAPLLAIGVFIGRQSKALHKRLTAAILPFMATLALYFIASLILVGNLNLGVGYKSYDSFEMNQAILTGGDIPLARQETQRLFGTQEENHGSILRAIARNPYAFSLRLIANAKTIPESYFNFFGKTIGVLLLFFAAWGIVALLRQKRYLMLVMLFIWPLHTLVALGFLSLHIIPQLSYLPFLLACIGISSAFVASASNREKSILLLISLGILLVSWATAKPAFAYSFLVLVVVLFISWLLQLETKPNPQPTILPTLMLLAAGLILHGAYAYPEYPTLGKTASEQAVHYLQKALPFQSTVLVPSPIQAIAAGMSYRTMEDIPAQIASIEELSGWLKQQGVTKLVLDSNRRVRNDLYDLLEQEYGASFSLDYASQDGTIRIFSVK